MRAAAIVVFARLMLGALVLLANPVLSWAQERSVLMADTMDVTANGVLTASGNVQIIFGQTQLRAALIRFEEGSGLTIEGPIQLILEDGTTAIFADAAQLDADLRNGILDSARMVLNAQVQLAANRIRRVDGRYTELQNTVASTCLVCAANPVPLWQIRAKSIIHDQEAKRLYFEDARFEFWGRSIIRLPRISLPDPTARRANGFLVPNLSNSDTLGLKLEVPYFFTLGPSADLTFSPLLSAKTRTLKLRYRRAWRAGRIELNGALSDDDLTTATRAYLFAEGAFGLGRGFALKFDAETTSDPSYLAEYGFSSKNRLDSQVAIERVRADQVIFAELTAFETLRGRELAYADLLPSLLAETRIEQVHDMSGTPAGGTITWQAGAVARWRAANTDVTGRDYLGLFAGANWQRGLTLANGLEARAGLGAELRADFVAQDSTYQPATTQLIPFGEVELRYPMARLTARGAYQSLTPIVHLAWSDSYGTPPPFEDGLLAELDQGNLFALSRLPGRDSVETGTRIAAGLIWSRRGPNGLDTRASIGRVWRDVRVVEFTAASGLGGRVSDWVLGAQTNLSEQISVSGNVLLDNQFALTRADTRVTYRGQELSLSAAHSWSVADPATNRTEPLSQLNLDGGYQFGLNWAGTGSLTYDFQSQEPIEAGLGMQFKNECLQLDLSLSRRFTGSGNILQNTDVGLKVAILGFGAGPDTGAQKSCLKL